MKCLIPNRLPRPIWGLFFLFCFAAPFNAVKAQQLSITCPPDIVLDCADPIPAAATNEAEFLAQGGTIDNPNGFPLAVTSLDITVPLGGDTYIIRTYTVTDPNGDAASCTQDINLFDTTPPVITCPADVTLDCNQSSDPVSTGMATASDDCSSPGTPLADIWINEFHYDNSGGDVGEFIEIAGPAGFDLSGCELALYNGNGGVVYNTIALSGMIDDEGAGFGAVSFSLPVNGLQNGAPDGIALACGGTVLEFLSYEGVMMANDGPAVGMTSVDVGVAEGGGTLIGESLQLQGSGSGGPEFTWVGPNAESPGMINANQTISSSPDPLVITFSDDSSQGTSGCDQYNYTITRTWTAVDPSGNIANCVQLITVQDTEAPTITCPDNLTISCDEPTDPANTGFAIATDNCTAGAGNAIWINELHYDNSGVDAGEFVEIAGAAGTDLSACELVLYNGNGGVVYNTVALNGMIDDEGAGYGAVSFSFPPNGLQNGSPDGMALVCGGEVLEFISYEGTITATDGPANGMTSTNIGVAEGGGTPIGQSLQLQGTGGESAAFTWSGPDAESPGSINANQTITFGGSGDITVDFTDVSTQGQGCLQYSYLIIRTWTATDECGNSSTCSQAINVQDLVAPNITCPADITVDCADPTDPGFTGYATASGDNCAADDELTVTFMDVSSQTPTGTGCSNDNYTITRTWTASDPCGNTSQCVQVITVQDTEAPVIICPPEVTIECDEPLVTLPVMGTTTASAPTNSVSWPNSGAGSTGLVGSVPVNISGIPAGAEVTDVNIHIDMDQSWVGDLNLTLESPDGTTVNFVDDLECGDTNSGSQDNISATFDSDAAGFSCGLSSNDVGDPDDCSNDYLAASAVSGTVQPQLGSFDVFDGTSAAGDWILSITDEAEGDGGCLINFTVEVSWTVAGGGMTGIPVAVDNCSAVGSIALDISDVTTQTASGCGQYEYVITRTWTATDACGNSSTCVQTINVEDTTAPDIVCPPTVNLDCNDSTDPSNTGMATAGVDNCSSANEVIVTFTDVSTQTGSGCGADTYTITRTWAATDACGNSSTCVQVINVADTTPPDITCPPGQTLTCFESLPDPISTAADFVAAGGTISDDCTANLSDFTVFAVADDNDGTNCPGDARIVVRTYFVLDACGNTTTCDQTFTYQESTMGPVITDVLPECYKYCASLANPMETDITYETDCSFGATVEITGPQVIGQENCPGTRYRYTYTVTDDCGRTASATRDFIIGNEGPTIECPPFNLILECGDPNNQDYIDQHLEQISVNTSCELGYTVSHFPSFFNLTACGSSTVVTFVATDDCGRSVTCSTTVAIQDNTGPAISSTYVPDVCNEAICGSDLNFWYDEWKEKVFDNLTAVDDCFSPIFWSTIPNSPSPNQNCPDEIAETVVQFVATDQCGNSSYVEYSFYVVPAEGPGPAGNVSGLIATEESESVENVTVSLEGNGNLLTDVTEADGMYEFADLELEQNYAITPYLDENPLNGVSTFDIVLMSKHILEMDLLDSPYKLIAADINQSGTITTIDIVELRKLILFIDDEFQNNTSWRFVAADYVFPDPANPFAATFPEVVDINSLTPEEVHDFVGIKIGDLNGSVQANLLAEADDRTVTEDLVFGLEDQQLKAGQTYEVAFTAADFESIHGYQFSLNFDADKLSFEGVEAGALSDLSARNFGLSLLERGVLTTSWSSQQGVSVVDGSTVFSVSFTAKADGQLSELLQISSTYTAAEAYNQDLDLMGVDLRFDTDEIAAGEFRLYQNTPNPFKATTTIGFHLPKGGSATLKVFDLSGRVLQVVEGDYDKGYNEVLVDRSDLSASGVLYYQLETADNQATRKMIVIE